MGRLECFGGLEDLIADVISTPMQAGTGKFTEIQLTRNQLIYAESRTLVNPAEHLL